MKKWLLIIIGMAMVFGGSTIFLKDTFGDSIEQVAEAVAVNAVATKINSSITTTLDDESLGEPLIYTEKDEEGNIQYLEPNSRLINKLIMSFSTKVKENYSLTDIEEIKVNLGVITGSRILSQLPFYITVKVQPVSLTKFQCETAFETQGINQTRYIIYCTVNSQINIVAPFTEKTAEINRKMVIAEAIIIGKVPDSYVVVPEESILDVVE